jgi:hypothetical protein
MCAEGACRLRQWLARNQLSRLRVQRDEVSLRAMARKFIAITVLLFACSQAFGLALLCKMPCCPETKAAAPVNEGSSVMPMHIHQHHLAATAHSHDESCVSASTCTITIKAPQPQIVRDNLASPRTARAAVSPKPVSLDLRQNAAQALLVEAASPLIPAVVLLRI